MSTKKTSKQIQRFATVTLSDGTKKRISARGQTEREAFQKLAKIKAEYEAGIRTFNSNTTFKVWAEEWIEIYKKNKVKAKTIKIDKTKLRLYFYPYIGNLSLGNITPARLQQCFNNMAELSESYITKTKFLINDIMEQARINDMIRKNPVEGITLPKGNPTKARRSLTDLERQLFLDACEKSPNGTMFLVSYYCGLRPAEVRALRWCDIDLKKETITVSHSLDSITQELIPPKSKTGYRNIPIPQKLKKELLKIPTAFNQEYFIFGQNKKPCTKQRYIRAFERIKRLMDIENGAETYRNQIVKKTIDYQISPYYLRHTYCTRLAENGVGLKTAQYLMGHSTIDMTANIYTHVTEKIIQNDIQKLKVL